MSAGDGQDGSRLTGHYLGLVAGFVDAVDYLRYHAFGANMTGNTVLFAIGVGTHEADAFAALRPIAAFIVGCVAARVILDRATPWAALATQTVVLAAAAVASAFTASAFLLTAVAMGIQNTAFATFAGVRANTSFLTGDYERLAQSVVELLGPKRTQARATLALVIPLVICYALGAFGGVLAVGRLAQPLWIAALLSGVLLGLRAVRAVLVRSENAV